MLLFNSEWHVRINWYRVAHWGWGWGCSSLETSRLSTLSSRYFLTSVSNSLHFWVFIMYLCSLLTCVCCMLSKRGRISSGVLSSLVVHKYYCYSYLWSFKSVRVWFVCSKTSIPGHSLHHLLLRWTYVNVDIHSSCLIVILFCLKSLLLFALSTNLSLTSN